MSMGPKRASVGPKRNSVGSKRRSASVSKREQACASVSTSPQLAFACIKLYILIDQTLVLVRLGLVSYPWHKTLRSMVF